MMHMVFWCFVQAILSGVPAAASRCLVNHGEPKMIWELMCIAVLLEETLLIRMFRLDIEGSRLGTSKKSTLFHCRIAEFSIMAFALIDDGCDGCGDDPFPAFPARGWSMRRGHRKAIETRIIRKSESLERIRWSNAPSLANVGLGRSAVKRSVNRSSRRFEKEEMDS